MRFDTPLSLTVDPVLEHAFRDGSDAWTTAVRDRGISATANWLIRRSVGVDLDEESVKDAIAGIALSTSAEDLNDARLELATLTEAGDLEMTELLWQGVRDFARTSDDAELMTEATHRLAAISGELDEPRALAAVWLDYLNWRRKPDSRSESDEVLAAFDAVIGAAEMCGAHREAARLGYLQVKFQQLVDSDDPSAIQGDWMPGQPPFALWS